MDLVLIVCCYSMQTSYDHIGQAARRTIVVGDIHGCWEEFRQLLDAVGFVPEDVLVCVGDFLDRGPGSWEVDRFLREIPNAQDSQRGWVCGCAGAVH